MGCLNRAAVGGKMKEEALKETLRSLHAPCFDGFIYLTLSTTLIHKRQE